MKSLLLTLLIPLPVLAASFSPDELATAKAIVAAIPDCQAQIHSIQILDLPGYDGWTDFKKNLYLAPGLSPEKLRITILHECGHLIDFFILKGTPHAGLSPFSYKTHVVFRDDPSNDFYAISWTDAHTRRSYKGFVTDYAKADCYEDMAESFAFMLTGATTTDPLLQKKFDWLKEHLPAESRLIAPLKHG
jgi:hypothetical protein